MFDSVAAEPDTSGEGHADILPCHHGQMRVVIAGGHGKIALILEQLLAARGDVPVGLIRNPSHATDLEAAGAQAVVLDLEHSTVDQVA